MKNEIEIKEQVEDNEAEKIVIERLEKSPLKIFQKGKE